MLTWPALLLKTAAEWYRLMRVLQNIKARMLVWIFGTLSLGLTMNIEN